MLRLLKILLFLCLALALGRHLPAFLPAGADLAKDTGRQFVEDSRRLANGDFRQSVAERHQDVAQSITAAPGADPSQQTDLHRELALTRQRLLEERADALKAGPLAPLHDDRQSLTRKTADNIRRSAGD